MRECNISLLGKWCWRMMVDKGGLWFRVFSSLYVVKGGRVKEGWREGWSCESVIV